MNQENKIFWDKSTKLLLVSNVVTIIFAVIEKWNLNSVLWVYWFQSVIIGYFSYIRILRIENPNEKNLTINELVKKFIKRRKQTDAYGFLLIYAWFQATYLIFLFKISFVQIRDQLINFNYLVLISLISIIVSVIIFYLNHRASFYLNCEEDLKGSASTQNLMLISYARILPMHIITAFAAIQVSGEHWLIGVFFTLVLVFFLIMKTVADIVMHKVEHNYLRKNVCKLDENIKKLEN